MSKKLTQKRLKELLRYDPETGIFTRLVSGHGKNANSIAGSVEAGGYRRIKINGKRYNASRLAFLYMEGYLPEYEVDHRNRIRHDDRWENLRHVSHQCNIRNRGILKNNKSGITGVSWIIIKQRWRASIKILGKYIYLGSFKSKLNAARARWEAEVKYGFPNCNTTSSAYLYIQNATN